MPDLSLGGIYPTSVLLHWLGSAEGQSSNSNVIEVNGVKVGEFRQGDTSIEILGLMPGNCYSIRVIAFNLAGNSASAPVIRVQTGLGTLPMRNMSVSRESSKPAYVRATSSRSELSEPHQVITDGNGIHNSVSCSMIDQKATMDSNMNVDGVTSESPLAADVEDESPEQIRNMRERLESLKLQKEEVDKQIEEDDSESRTQIAELVKEKEHLKQVYKEKEEASAELKKHGNYLDKLNRSSQSRKAAKAKHLQQKKAERQRVTDDTARWEREVVEMRKDIEYMAREKTRILAEKDAFILGKRKVIGDDQAVIKVLEEDIRVKGIQIKALEQRREKMTINGGDNEERDRIRIEKGKDEAWEYRYQSMQSELAHRRQELQTASMEEQRAKDVLNWWLEKRAKSSEHCIPIPGLEFPSVSRNKSRRNRHSNSRTSTVSSSNHHGRPASLGDDSVMVPPFASATPFFNMGNGTAISPGSGPIESSQEANMLTGGALMSPAASELLPSNLFRDEDIANQISPAVCRDSFGKSGNEGFVQHAVPASDASNRGPNTPASGSSRGGSILPSPRESTQNLHGFHSRSDTFDDNDRQSINSIPASLRPALGADSNALAPHRFANLFSSPFSRQRGKSSEQEPPMLGTLKQGQSHSFDIDDVGGRRRRGSHGYWANPIGNLLARNSTDPAGAVMTSSGRKSRLNMFGSRLENIEPSVSSNQPSTSRPSSTYSHDGLFGRLSSESQNVMWPMPDGLPNRNSPLGVNWAPTSGGPWSHVPSRRPSIQLGSTSNLSLGTTPLDSGEYVGSLRKQTSDQAPIGTRPQSSQRPVTPRLNPAAPSFRTLFSRGGGDAKKMTKQEKATNKASDKSRDKEFEEAEADDGGSIDDVSLSNSRLSRDGQSVTTATSAAGSYDSIDRSTSGTPSEIVTPSGPKEPKESLMQKITRKSSSSKFNVPWSKDRSGGLFSKRVGEPSTPGEVDGDTSSEGQFGRNIESPGGTPQQEKPGRTSLSWPNIRRKSRKGDLADKGSEAGEDDD